MALDDAKRSSRKRKESQDEYSFSKAHQDAGNLEMMSDEEAGGGVDSDDGQLEEFPEIDVASDSEEEEDESDEQSDGESYDDNEEEEESDDSEIPLFPKSKNVISDITGKLKRIYPEIEPDYDSDSSTEDVSNSFIAFFNKTFYIEKKTTNRVGDVPMHWYDDLPHVGYDINGKQVLRPARGDELDKFLATVEDPSSW
jgi:ribosome biogenesis protein ERB1